MESSIAQDHFLLISTSLKNAIGFLSKKEYSALNSAQVSLFKEACRELNRLRASLDDLTLVSLSVRNIFEIYLILKHVGADEKALHKWYGQSHKDSKEIRDGFIRLMEKRNLDTAELRKMQDFEDHNLAASPFQSEHSFNMKILSEKYGHLDDYLLVYKLSSKLVHPSSMKVMVYDVLSENTNYLNVVLEMGVHFTHELNDYVVSVVTKA
jgi:hypothetical protein